jgi:O-antigen ligase
LNTEALSVDKNSLRKRIESWKGWIATLAILGMLSGLLCSRAALSISMMVFGVNALWNVNPKHWFGVRIWVLTLPWLLLFAASGFWSADKEMLADHLQVKLPLLLLPLAFHFTPRPSQLQLRILGICTAALMLGGTVFSLSFLFKDGLVEGYKYSHIIPTPVYNDHIAFSLAVALTVGWFLFLLPQIGARWIRIALSLSAVLLAAYLHVLAAKTGLVALYILLAALVIRKTIQAPRTGVVLLLTVGAAIAFSMVYIPTLRERIGYSIVTWRSLNQGERNGIYSDAGRLISYDLALRSVAAHPAAGVGAGDVFEVMKEGYRVRYPDVDEAQQLWPHNQLLVFAMAAGIPCALLFAIWYGSLLGGIRRNRNGFFQLTQWLMLLVPLMVDAFLEVQFGVAVFLMFLLLQRLTARRSAMDGISAHDELHPHLPLADRGVSGRSTQPAHI